ncbi:MAG: M28 family peptidase, partial [Steroidobacteraceae bacterium]
MVRENISHVVALFLALASASALTAESAPVPAQVVSVAQAEITKPVLEAPIRYLADDLLEGRGPATRGDQLARLYLATQLEMLGYAPGGTNGSYQQPFDIVGTHAQMPEKWSFATKGQTVDLKWSDDYIAGSGVQEEQGAIKDAELVFVGYGIEAPEFKWDDYKGQNLKGKVFVMLNNDPDWDPNLFAGKTRLYYGRWTYKYEIAARKGAAAVIIVHTRDSAGYPWQVVQTSWGGTQFELPAESEPRVQLRGWATEDAMRRLLKTAGYDLDKLTQSAHSRKFKPVTLGIRTSLSFRNTVEHSKTGNVAGVLKGSDPKLSSEVVVYSAHLDHLGIADAKPGDAKDLDRIYNGAEDNASGCAQVLAVARAMAALPERPRRTTLILFVGMEEQGLLGSEYYAKHPT